MNDFEIIKTIGTVHIPESVEKIGHGGFYYLASLKEISIPKNVKEISCGAFYHCPNLEKIKFFTIPKIDLHAFKFCNIKNIIISSKLNIEDNKMEEIKSFMRKYVSLNANIEFEKESLISLNLERE